MSSLTNLVNNSFLALLASTSLATAAPAKHADLHCVNAQDALYIVADSATHSAKITLGENNAPCVYLTPESATGYAQIPIKETTVGGHKVKAVKAAGLRVKVTDLDTSLPEGQPHEKLVTFGESFPDSLIDGKASLDYLYQPTVKATPVVAMHLPFEHENGIVYDVHQDIVVKADGHVDAPDPIEPPAPQPVAEPAHPPAAPPAPAPEPQPEDLSHLPPGGRPNIVVLGPGPFSVPVAPAPQVAPQGGSSIVAPGQAGHFGFFADTNNVLYQVAQFSGSASEQSTFGTGQLVLGFNYQPASAANALWKWNGSLFVPVGYERLTQTVDGVETPGSRLKYGLGANLKTQFLNPESAWNQLLLDFGARYVLSDASIEDPAFVAAIRSHGPQFKVRAHAPTLFPFFGPYRSGVGLEGLLHGNAINQSIEGTSQQTDFGWNWDASGRAGLILAPQNLVWYNPNVMIGAQEDSVYNLVGPASRSVYGHNSTGGRLFFHATTPLGDSTRLALYGQGINWGNVQRTGAGLGLSVKDLGGLSLYCERATDLNVDAKQATDSCVVRLTYGETPVTAQELQGIGKH